jgi:hypothetical protein
MPDVIETTPALPRALGLAQPMQRGEDVMALQRLLLRADPTGAGREIRVVDGLFGPATRRAVAAFQARTGLPERDGLVGPKTWAMLHLWRDGRGPLAAAAAPAVAESRRRNGPAAILAAALPALMEDHAVFSGGSRWRLTPAGLVVSGRPMPGATGDMPAASRAFAWFGEAFRLATEVPVELLVATACTEVLGDTRRFATPAAAARARREEPGYLGDEATPHRVSVGVMQTLVSTARQVTVPSLTAAELEDPALSIEAGARVIAGAAARTRLDPPVVACAYNAGAVSLQEGPANHWRMRQYPIGTPAHADRFVVFLNHAFRLIASDPALLGGPDVPSLWRALNGA